MKYYMRFCLLLTALCFALAAHAQETGKAKPKLAVLPFQNKVANPYWWHGGAEAAQDVFVTELMKAMQDVFITELRGAKRFTVVEREQLEALMREKNLTLSGDLDPATAVNLGKSLGVQRLLTGALTEYGVTNKRLSGSSAGKRNFVAAINARLIDTSTGEILWADEARAEDSSVKANVSGAGSGVDGVRVFEETITPCVKRLIKKWRASKFFDIFPE